MATTANLKDLFSLEGKVVVMTGAAGGIGAALAKGLAGIGATLCNCDISGDGLEVLQQEIAALGGKADSYIMNVADISSIEKATGAIVARHGRIDVLVNVAGINKREGIVALLASDASSYMSGANYVIDGGCLCGGAPWDFDSVYRNTDFSAR